MNSNSNTYKVIKGISSQTLVTLALGIGDIVVFSIMSRLLSKEDFGLFAAISAVTLIFGSLSEAGIGSAVIQKKNADSDYIDTCFSLSFILGLFFSLLLFFFSVPIARLVASDEIAIPLKWMSITILCNSLTSVNFGIIYRKLQFLRVGVINLFSLLVSSTLAIFLAIKGQGYYAILVKSICGAVVTTLVSFILINTKLRFRIERTYVKSIVNFGGWLTLSVLLRNFAQQADKLLMSSFLSVVSLGSYNRPKEFINTISIKLNGIFDTALFPILSGIQDNKNSIRNSFISSLFYMNLFSMILALSFIFNSELIIRIFFGEKWLDLQLIFIILSLSLIFNIDGRLCDCYFRSLALVKYQFFIRIIEFGLTIVCLLIGFNWDILGVSIGVFVANVLTILIKLFVISNRVECNRSESFSIILQSWRFILILVPLYIVCMILLSHTFIGNIAFLCVFIISLIVVFVCFPQIVGQKYFNEVYKNLVLKNISKFAKYLP